MRRIWRSPVSLKSSTTCVFSPKFLLKMDIIGCIKSGAITRAGVAVNNNSASPELDDRLRTRLNQVFYGKNTVGYDLYRLVTPRGKRVRGDPSTPDANLEPSKRAWDEKTKSWRRALHRQLPLAALVSGGEATARSSAEKGTTDAAEEEEQSVWPHPSGYMKARVLNSRSVPGALVARLLYGECRQESVGRHGFGATIRQRITENGNSGGGRAGICGRGVTSMASLVPGPRGPLAGSTIWDETAGGWEESMGRKWEKLMDGLESPGDKTQQSHRGYPLGPLSGLRHSRLGLSEPHARSLSDWAMHKLKPTLKPLVNNH